jgi:hypothetical protein
MTSYYVAYLALPRGTTTLIKQHYCSFKIAVSFFIAKIPINIISKYQQFEMLDTLGIVVIMESQKKVGSNS